MRQRVCWGSGRDPFLVAHASQEKPQPLRAAATDLEPGGLLESGGWHWKMFIPKVPKVVAQPRPLLEQMLSIGQSSAGRSCPSRLPVGTRPLRAGSRLRSWCRRLHPRGLSPRASVCSAARAENPTRVREGKHVLRSRHIPNFAKCKQPCRGPARQRAPLGVRSGG